MSDFNVLEQIKKLVKLQQDDTELYNLRKALEEKPAVLQRLQQEFELKKARLNDLQEKLKKVQVERSTLEGDLAQKDEAIVKADAQLAMIKTNKEYTAKIGEIEGIKADKSILEEKILESYDKTEEVKALIDQEKEVLTKEEEAFKIKKQEVEAEIADLENKLKEFNELRQDLLDGVDKNLLIRYERILNSREGLAVVPVIGNVCGGCFMNLPPQMVNEIRKQKEIIACEICTRILYIEEDLEKVEFISSEIDPSEEASIVIRDDEAQENLKGDVEKGFSLHGNDSCQPAEGEDGQKA